MLNLASNVSPHTSPYHWLKGTWMDRTLLMIATITIALSWQWLSQHLHGIPMIHIYHGKTLLAVYPLHPKETIHFNAKGDIGISKIIINQDGVRMIDSPCTTKRCILSGHRHHIGDMIACVPNRILISIQGTEKSQLDAISE